ncbi:hypothetical protein ACIBH1_12160 [Nonomuraea sp. NPDC050663]
MNAGFFVILVFGAFIVAGMGILLVDVVVRQLKDGELHNLHGRHR